MVSPLQNRFIQALMLLGVWSVVGLVNATRLHYEVGLSWHTSFWYGAPDALIWALLTPLVVLFSNRWPIRRSHFVLRLLLHLVLAAGMSLLHSCLDVGVHVARAAFAGQQAPIALIFDSVFTHTTHLNVLLYFLIAGFAHYVAYSRRLVERERQAAELRAQLSEARLSALRMQLRPHFLFNSLHTISGLMQQDVEVAQGMVQQLGELLRLSLTLGEKDAVELRRELEFVRAYLAIEQERFRDRLETRIEVDAGLEDCQVPAFILQPLVENAIRHGISKNPEGGTLVVAARRTDGGLELSVTDDGPGLGRNQVLHPFEIESDHHGDQDSKREGGVGLSNIRKRLRELYPDDGTLSLEDQRAGGVRARIWLPLEVPA